MAGRFVLGRTSFNLVTSIASYAVSLVVAIAYTPFLVRELGLAAYSMIALCFALVQYAGPITQTITATLNQRLVATFSDPDRFTDVFSTAVSLCFALSIALAVLALGVSLSLDHLVHIPPDLAADTRLLFLSTAGAFSAAVLVIPLSGVVFAHNAIYLLNLKQAVEAIVRVLAVVALFITFAAHLHYVALAIGLSSAAGVAIMLWAALLLRPNLRYVPSRSSTSIARGMTRTGGGVVLIQIGTLFLLNSDLLVVNLLYGPETGGAYAAAAHWAVVLRGLLLSVGTAVTARVMLDCQLRHGTDRIDGIAQAMRLMSAFAALPAGYVAGISPQLLHIWIGPELASQANTLMILALPAAVNVVAVPILAAQLATDRVSGVGFGYLVAGMLFVPTAMGASALLGWGGIEVAIVLGVFLFAKNHLLVIPMAAAVLGPGAARKLTLASLYPIGWTLVAAAITGVIADQVELTGFGGLIGVGMVVSVLYGGIALATLPQADQRVVLEALGHLARLTSAQK